MKQQNDDLQEAIDQFPILSWLQQRFHVRDSGAQRLRIDCPVCRGQKTLSVAVDEKLFHCFRCDEGGQGGGVWNGKANLFSFLKIVEGVSNKAAFERIRSLAGLPDVPRARTTKKVTGFPREAIPLATVRNDHPAVQMLIRRKVAHLIPHAKVCVDGEFSDRILFPCFFLGEIVGFEAKSFVAANPKSKLQFFDDKSPKIYTSMNWDEKSDRCTITESILDAESCPGNAVGIFGSVLREEQLLSLLELRKLGLRRLQWSLDGDAMKKQHNSIRSKTRLFFDNSDILLKMGEDPNSVGSDEMRLRIAAALPVVDGFDLFSRPRY